MPWQGFGRILFDVTGKLGFVTCTHAGVMTLHIVDLPWPLLWHDALQLAGLYAIALQLCASSSCMHCAGFANGLF